MLLDATGGWSTRISSSQWNLRLAKWQDE
uniref:Uncharacterized protein n=1 Tax=Caenorhabditis japonica TaxID=281687 RepID=A0A8R1EL76_CAEJA